MINRSILIWLVMILISCNSNNTTTIEKHISSSNSEVYEYDLGFFGDEEGSWIDTQAKHFEISEVKRDHTIGQHIYTYKPKEGFTGVDIVEVKMNKGSNGAGRGVESILKIVFNISD
ncbi:hypothetical protein D1818_15020 [Aquimarina sp. BL5]|uniref:hypothetical protein n=1 Tax=Aquimarina sp. BL5 TaxID=1714860 RepID=UPI000E51F90F|nr:hypothetical protein [Aquimarina sp. BL5]AXT52086.1 hypothetical protein D1818_15020 [Aquimarina sp. BL5]RKN05170.1 hypothetical protein D7036_11030 [Aquimarina sp. BL5]